MRVGPGLYTPQPDMRAHSFNVQYAPDAGTGGVGYGVFEAPKLAPRPNRVTSAAPVVPPLSRYAPLSKTEARVMSAGSGGRVAVVPPARAAASAR